MPSIEVTQRTAQYTDGGEYAHVQFAWRTAATETVAAGIWHRESYSPPQAQLSARAPEDILAVAPGYWSDDEVREDVRAWITTQYGYTDISFLEAGS